MPLSIMLVEDSPTILNLLSLMLRQQGFAVNTAGDGMEALEKLKKTKVDLIITDVNMPRMDGFKFIANLRADKSQPRVPVIVLSTEGEEHDMLKGEKVGADLYLTKPVQPQELVGSINRLLGIRTGISGA